MVIEAMDELILCTAARCDCLPDSFAPDCSRPLMRGGPGAEQRVCPGSLGCAAGVRRPGAESPTGIGVAAAMAVSGASEDASARKAHSREARPRPPAR